MADRQTENPQIGYKIRKIGCFLSELTDNLSGFQFGTVFVMARGCEAGLSD